MFAMLAKLRANDFMPLFAVTDFAKEKSNIHRK